MVFKQKMSMATTKGSVMRRLAPLHSAILSRASIGRQRGRKPWETSCGTDRLMIDRADVLQAGGVSAVELTEESETWWPNWDAMMPVGSQGVMAIDKAGIEHLEAISARVSRRLPT